ncbi:MAG TPA: hypothetical protein VKE51_39890 [Vicinamibacterales bacterium]|nr:hypothetical protein [Vicinamibacterales bacterium]
MRAKGINYDTGFLSAGTSTHEPFDPEVMRREMRIIRDDLHCTAVRITGGDPDRLEIAATHAADAGLEVWFCPFTNGLTQDVLLALLADCAGRAERLRLRGAEVVFLTGSELSLFTAGFLPGETLAERLALATDPLRVRPVIGEIRARLNDFLRRAVDACRARFGGRVSYASLPLEGVDWTPFDIIATDAAYRSAVTAPHFRENVRGFVAQGHAQGKLVAATEFGCATYVGAGNGASYIDQIILWDDAGRASGLNGDFVRDENEQATYVREVLDVFAAEGIDAAFVYTFARYDLPHRSDPAEDLDMASAGVVKVLDGPRAARNPRSRRYPDMPWEPKAAFDAVADWFGR